MRHRRPSPRTREMEIDVLNADASDHDRLQVLATYSQHLDDGVIEDFRLVDPVTMQDVDVPCDVMEWAERNTQDWVLEQGRDE